MKNKILTICLILTFQPLVSQNVWQWGIKNDTNNYSSLGFTGMTLDPTVLSFYFLKPLAQ
jgi:hypothetical protein